MSAMDCYDALLTDNDGHVDHHDSAEIKQHNQKKNGRRRLSDTEDVWMQTHFKNSFYKFLARFSGRRRSLLSGISSCSRQQSQLLSGQRQRTGTIWRSCSRSHSRDRCSSIPHNNNNNNNNKTQPTTTTTRGEMHRNFKLIAYTIVLLLLTRMCTLTDACSSRSTPKPRPPPPSGTPATTTTTTTSTTTTTTPRPNITFHTYKCPPAYDTWYCLNSATCFTVKIGETLLYNCECADGYMGPRCEYKDLDGSYLPTRQRAMLEQASIASGAVLAIVMIAIVCFSTYVRKHRLEKQRLVEMDTSGHRLDIAMAYHAPPTNGATNGDDNGTDTVDSAALVAVHAATCQATRMPSLRPFGPHHSRIIPMAAAYGADNIACTQTTNGSSGQII